MQNQTTTHERPLALIIGASGGIGAAIVNIAEQSTTFTKVIGISRTSTPMIDLCDEQTIITAAQHIKASGLDLRLVFDATGFLHGMGYQPEKTLNAITPEHMAHSFAINAIGPALLMKHILPLFPKTGKATFATLSAKVGSIADNSLGGWYSYRASKAALNQFVRSAAIELARKKPDAICVALHPGTVDTSLSSDFAKTGLIVRKPEAAAQLLLNVIDHLTPAHSGGFFDDKGDPLPW